MTSRDVLRRIARSLAPLQPRRALVSTGAHLSPVALTRLTNALGGLEQGRWLADVAPDLPNLPDRFAVFDVAIRRVIGSKPLYLEFGVYRGRTMRYWASHLPSPQARLVGFDSFEGLPENWQPNAQAGAFSVGRPPEIDDPRVSFVVGWFERTLPSYEPPAHDQLIVNVDCDLYSSTRSVLDWLAPHLRAGTLVYFDDLFNRDHQWRALQEWLAGSGSAARPVAMARWGHHLLFELPPLAAGEGGTGEGGTGEGGTGEGGTGEGGTGEGGTGEAGAGEH
ncbi:MAG: class I SAM-dependent methyltransferase [Actinomycetota bacterium]|nr:class I SAM-dependent methyltransferase [Actinomycetota bacterium]